MKEERRWNGERKGTGLPRLDGQVSPEYSSSGTGLRNSVT
jgi:hypothetical protein